MLRVLGFRLLLCRVECTGILEFGVKVKLCVQAGSVCLLLRCVCLLNGSSRVLDFHRWTRAFMFPFFETEARSHPGDGRDW